MSATTMVSSRAGFPRALLVNQLPSTLLGLPLPTSAPPANGYLMGMQPDLMAISSSTMPPCQAHPMVKMMCTSMAVALCVSKAQPPAPAHCMYSPNMVRCILTKFQAMLLPWPNCAANKATAQVTDMITVLKAAMAVCSIPMFIWATKPSS